MNDVEPVELTVDQLRGSAAENLICYPNPDPSAIESRLDQLKGLGVEKLRLEGPSKIGGVAVLGKGCTSIVIKACANKRTVALKARRLDSGRPDMSHEAEMLKLANEANVGPSLLGFSKDFLVMEYVAGDALSKWIDWLPLNRHRVLRKVIRELVEECYKLDRVGLDHGELSRAPKNVLVDRSNKARIVDFESASNHRRARNVTCIVQYLFVGSAVASKIRSMLAIRRPALIRSLKAFKRAPTQDKLHDILVKAHLT